MRCWTHSSPAAHLCLACNPHAIAFRYLPCSWLAPGGDSTADANPIEWLLRDTMPDLRTGMFVSSGLRPFSAYLAACVAITYRRGLHVGAICVIGWAPAALALWLLFVLGLHVPSANELLDLLDGGPSSALDSVLPDPSAALRLLGLFAVAYVLGQALVSGALTHQLYWAAEGTPRSSLESLRRSAARLHRTVPAVVMLAGLVAFPLVAGTTVAGWLLWDDGTSWQRPVMLGTACTAAFGILAVVAWGRLALWPAAAVLAPRGVLSPAVSVRCTSRRWWQTVLRLLVATLAVAAVTSAVSAPLIAVGAAGSAAVIAVAVTTRIVLSIVSSGISQSAAALIYCDTSAPAAP